jgi:hypothetical protein
VNPVSQDPKFSVAIVPIPDTFKEAEVVTPETLRLVLTPSDPTVPTPVTLRLPDVAIPLTFRLAVVVIPLQLILVLTAIDPVVPTPVI